MISRISLFFITFLLSVSCAEQKVQPEDENAYILFGHFYGFCMGEQCIEIFKLTDSELFEDLKDQYPSSQEFYIGDYKKLDQEKFELVKSLKNNIPFELTQEKNHRIGTPDVTDGGGVYFAIVNERGTKYWLIDQFDQNIPVYLKPFKDQINQSISLIND